MQQKTSEKVSVIIPTYNREDPLIDTVSQVLNESYPNFELLIVDQTKAHSDSFLKWIKDLSAKDKRIKYISLSKASLPYARNVGVRKASGEIIIFIDDDVILKEGFISSHVAAYANRDIKAVAGRVITNGKEIDESEKSIKYGLNGICFGKFTGTQEFFADTARGCNMSFKKEIIEKYNGFDEHFVGNAIREESDLCLRIKEDGGKILFCPEAEVTHLEIPTGGTRDDKKVENRYDLVNNYRNDFYFFFKHFSIFRLPLFLITIYGYYVFADFIKRRVPFATFKKRHLTMLQGFVQGANAYLKYKDDERWGSERRINIGLWLFSMVGVYTIILSVLSYIRFAEYHSDYYDMGFNISLFHNTLNGHFLMVYNELSQQFLFTSHQNYIIFLLIPLAKYLPSPLWMFVLQSFVLGLGAVFVYLIARYMKNGKRLSLFLSAFYLLTPTLQWTNLFDFHFEVLATSMLLALWYLLVKKKYFWAFLVAILAISCKENIGFSVGTIGLAVSILEWDATSLLFFLFGFTVTFIEVLKISKIWNNLYSSYSIYYQNYIFARYGYLGNSFSEMLHNLIFSPILYVKSLFYPFDKLYFLLLIFFQTGFVAILTPVILIALPELFIDLLGAPTMHQVYYQYTFAINAFIWISIIYALPGIAKMFRRHKILFGKEIAVFVIMVFLVIANLFYSPIFRVKVFHDLFIPDTQRINTLNHMVSLVPSGASVDATDHISDHLASTHPLELFPGECNANYILYEPVYTYGGGFYNSCINVVQKDYIIIYRNGGYFVAKRK